MASKALLITAVVASALLLAGFFLIRRSSTDEPRYGMTFSKLHAQELGLPWQDTYQAMFYELGVRLVRLPLYWWDIESEEGIRRWEDYDWMVQEAERHGASVTIVVGAKVPRWPECFIPGWAKELPAEARKEAQFAFVRSAVERYRSSSAVIRWQVENEPGLPYGECEGYDASWTSEEIALVRSLDDRPIQVTVSGELERWGKAAREADVLGFSVYRRIWSGVFGHVSYPIPPAFYRLRRSLVSKRVSMALVSELQAEPWFGPEDNERSSEDYARFTAEDLENHIAYAHAIGAPEVYLWGVEWWAFLRAQGESRLWEAGKAVFK